MDRCVTRRVNVTSHRSVIIKEGFDFVFTKGQRSMGIEDVSAEGLLIRPVYLLLQSLIESNGRTSSIDMLVRDFVASNYRRVAAAADKSGSARPPLPLFHGIRLRDRNPTKPGNFLLVVLHRDSMTLTANYFLRICRRFS